jgi:hypothetical protein
LFSRSLLLQDESPPFESDLLAQPSARWSTVSIHDRQPSSSTTITPTIAEEQGRLEEYILNSEPTTRRATEGAIAVSVSPSPATTEYYQNPKDEGAGKQWAQRSIGPAKSTNPFRRARAPLEAPALGVEMKQKGETPHIRPESPNVAMRTDGGLSTVTYKPFIQSTPLVVDKQELDESYDHQLLDDDASSITNQQISYPDNEYHEGPPGLVPSTSRKFSFDDNEYEELEANRLDYERNTNDQQLRRWINWKQLQLFNGNLVVDRPIPEAILHQVPHALPPERDEFTHSRFTAATCKPSEFWDQRYVLRPLLFEKPRNTELLIVVPFSGADGIAFAKTVHAIIWELRNLSSKDDFRERSNVYGWKAIVLCFLNDAVPVHHIILDILGQCGLLCPWEFNIEIVENIEGQIVSHGVFDDGHSLRKVKGRNVTARIYEVCLPPSSSMPRPTY